MVVNGSISGPAVGTTTSDSKGNYSIPVGPLADGSYTFLVQATNTFGTTKSGQTTITIDTQGPTTVPTLGLDPRDDTGVKGDGITANRRPRLIGVADPNVIVELLDANHNVLTSTISDASGDYSVQLPGQLSNGVITLFAQTFDIARNPGPASSSPSSCRSPPSPAPRPRRCSRRLGHRGRRR